MVQARKGDRWAKVSSVWPQAKSVLMGSHPFRSAPKLGRVAHPTLRWPRAGLAPWPIASCAHTARSGETLASRQPVCMCIIDQQDRTRSSRLQALRTSSAAPLVTTREGGRWLFGTPRGHAVRKNMSEVASSVHHLCSGALSQAAPSSDLRPERPSV